MLGKYACLRTRGNLIVDVQAFGTTASTFILIYLLPIEAKTIQV